MEFKLVIEHRLDEQTRNLVKDIVELVSSKYGCAELDALTQAVNEMKHELSNLLHLEGEMSNKFEELRNEVQALRTAEDSAIALIKGFADKIEEAGTDAQELALLVADMRSGREALAEAVTANTSGNIAEPIPMTRPVPSPDLIDPNDPGKDLGTSTQTTQSVKSPDAETTEELDGPKEPTP